nr:unnamed protein product [Amyelois transitella]
MASLISSGCSYGTIPWNFILPVLLSTFGRRRTFLFVNCALIITSVIFYISDSPNQLLIFEIITGLPHSGTVTVAVIILAEYTSPKYRGMFLMTKSASIHWGIWVSNVIGTFFSWRYIAVVGFVCSLYTLTAFFWPESPFWLANKGRFNECKRSHRWLKGNGEFSKKELDNLLNYQNYENLTIRNGNIFRFFRTISSREFYKPIFVITLCVCLYIFSGKLVCSIYAIDIFKRITKNDSAAYTGMLILDGATVFSMYVGCLLCRFLKRRTLLLCSATVSILFLFTISLYLFLVKLSLLVENAFLSIALLGCYSFSVGCGPTIMATSLYAELVPLRHKSLSVVLVSIIFMSLLATSLNIAPFIFKSLGMHGTFLFYGMCMSVFTILVFCFLPETKDKTLIEIDQYFKGEEKLQNKGTDS